MKNILFNEYPPPGLVLFWGSFLCSGLVLFCFTAAIWQLISLSPGYRCRMGKASDYQLSDVAGRPSNELQFIT